MLISLAYRIPRPAVNALLGTVVAYPLGESFADAWQTLPQYTDGTRRKQAPHKSLATALTAATGQPVQLFARAEVGEEAADPMLLVTDEPIDHRLPIAVDTWERRVRRGRGDNLLAARLPPPEPSRHLHNYVSFRDGHVPHAPGWVFRTATWQLLKRLATQSLWVDGLQIPFRLDTAGTLLSWDAPIMSRSGQSYGMARITAGLVTHPGISDLVIRFNASLTRITDDWKLAKHAWIAPNSSDKPLLRLGIHARRHADSETWTHHARGHIAEVLEACELAPIQIPETLASQPGPFRAQLRRPVENHGVGVGVGPRFMMRLHEHITTHIPELVPLQLDPDKSISLATLDRKESPQVRERSIGGTGHHTLRLVILYATQQARTRMLAEIASVVGRTELRFNDDEIHSLNERLEVVTHHCPDLLAHRNSNQPALLEAMPTLHDPGDRLTAAWVETEYSPKVENTRQPDAKHRLRRNLGHLGIPSQFLATDPDNARKRSEETKKHAATAALHDLFRASGVLDPRIEDAARGRAPHHQHALGRDAVLVGIHARLQTGSNNAPPQLALVMVAIHASCDPEAAWSATMYSESAGRWRPIGLALADYHARQIGTTTLGRTKDKATLTRDIVEERLAKLVADASDLPVIIFVDAEETRLLWPGLQNTRLRDGQPLPGDTLRAAGHDIAVVRCNSNPDEIGRPVTRVGAGKQPTDPYKPAAPGRTVYRVTDSTEPVWYFGGASKTYTARYGDTGADFTRWTLPDRLSTQQFKPWHSFTATEIAVITPGGWTPDQTAALAARLIEQPPYWNGRVHHPTPLHLAGQADKDHPDHRQASGDDGDIHEQPDAEANDK